MPVPMLPPPPPDTRLAELNTILRARRDRDPQSANLPTGAAAARAPARQIKLPFPRISADIGKTTERRRPRQLVGAALSAYHRYIEHNLVAAANATMHVSAYRASERQHEENERMAIIEGEREGQLIREAERYAELAYLRAKGAA